MNQGYLSMMMEYISAWQTRESWMNHGCKVIACKHGFTLTKAAKIKLKGYKNLLKHITGKVLQDNR